MSALDVNTWYQIKNQANATRSLTQGGINDSGLSAVFMAAFDDTNTSKQWQSYPMLDTSTTVFYLVRPRGLKPSWLLDVFSPACDETPCPLVPYVGNISEASAKSAWASWNENIGTFYIHNAQNGSGYRLDMANPSDTGNIESLAINPEPNGGAS